MSSHNRCNCSTKCHYILNDNYCLWLDDYIENIKGCGYSEYSTIDKITHLWLQGKDISNIPIENLDRKVGRNKQNGKY